MLKRNGQVATRDDQFSLFDFARSRQIVDLTNQFEHEEKLAVATKRQQEIVAALDITKNQASAKIDEGIEQVAVVMDQTPSENQRCANRLVGLAP